MVTPRRRTAKYYPVARTAHLERLHDFSPAVFFYTASRLDFDMDRAPVGTAIVQCSVFDMLRRVYRDRIETLEVPEPMVMTQWPQLITVHATVALWKMFGLRRVSLVSYCIENYPVHLKVAIKLRTTERVARILARGVVYFLLSTTERVAFGTEDSRRTYEDLVSGPLERIVENELVWALPRARSVAREQGEGVVFLGTFEDRKGIGCLMEAWPHVVREAPSARLTILGMGGRLEAVRRFAASTPSVELLVCPPRTRIFEELDRAKALVLFSQPTSRWKEQVGLPLLEGLSFGCEIVASDETGVSCWLASHGHQVLEHTAQATALARGIRQALVSTRSKKTILSSLPAEDGRIVADHYLFQCEDV
ncbi:glycosyltransferase [Kocuria sp. CH-021]|uniref:glycosyltransferase n=1 Tax=Kocuria sp. CH-021 TaxID=3406735 RepID=UPI003C76385E